MVKSTEGSQNSCIEYKEDQNGLSDFMNSIVLAILAKSRQTYHIKDKIEISLLCCEANLEIRVQQMYIFRKKTKVWPKLD